MIGVKKPEPPKPQVGDLRCKTVIARTHAEFLNKMFGTNYVRRMNCTWKYNDQIIVWMVRFYGRVGDWENRLLDDDDVIHERYVGDSPSGRVKWPHDARVAVAIEERNGIRQYQIKGLYRFCPDESNTRLHVFRRVPHEQTVKWVPCIYEDR